MLNVFKSQGNSGQHTSKSLKSLNCPNQFLFDVQIFSLAYFTKVRSFFLAYSALNKPNKYTNLLSILGPVVLAAVVRVDQRFLSAHR